MVAVSNGVVAICTREGALVTMGKDLFALGQGAPLSGCRTSMPIASCMNPIKLLGFGTPGGASAHVVAGGGNGAGAFFMVLGAQGMYSWGAGACGQLGHGDHENQHVPTRLPVGVCGGVEVVSVACGVLHSCVLTKSGHVWSCGNNDEGQLGIEGVGPQSSFRQTSARDVRRISCGSWHVLALNVEGEVLVWGTGLPGGLGLGNTRRQDAPLALAKGAFGGGRVQMLSAGGHHSVAVAPGGVYVFGGGSCGQLGLGGVGDRSVPTLLGGVGDVKFVSCGPDATAYVDKMGRLYVCGGGGNAKLGVGGGGNVLVPTMLPCKYFGGRAIASAVLSDCMMCIVDAHGRTYVCGYRTHQIPSAGGWTTVQKGADTPVQLPCDQLAEHRTRKLDVERLLAVAMCTHKALVKKPVLAEVSAVWAPFMRKWALSAELEWH